MASRRMINFFLIILFSFLSSCTSVELAANLGKKVFLKKDQLENLMVYIKLEIHMLLMEKGIIQRKI